MANFSPLTRIEDKFGSQQAPISALSPVMTYAFGDITRVNLGNGSQTPKASSYNAGELLFSSVVNPQIQKDLYAQKGAGLNFYASA